MDELLDRVSSGGRLCIPLKSKVLILLWYLASQDKYSSVADRFGTSEFTVCNTIRKLVKFITEYLLLKFIVWPSNNKMLEISKMYEDSETFLE